MRWLGELASHADELAARGVGVVAIAVDEADDLAASQVRLGALHPIPATFVVSGGLVRWRYLPGTGWRSDVLARVK